MTQKISMWIGIAVIVVFVLSCSQHSTPITEEKNKESVSYIEKGDSLTTIVQTALVKQVTQAIQTQGTANAVSFCSEKAMPLTDSMSIALGVTIQRLSDKNRNTANAIQSEEDQAAWQKMKELTQDTLQAKKHFILTQGTNTYYYKAIMIGMPACLQCHGETVATDVKQVIQAKYPQDKALGYKLGALRGMWKVKINS